MAYPPFLVAIALLVRKRISAEVDAPIRFSRNVALGKDVVSQYLYSSQCLVENT
ncbi:hypothetical protein [Nostoc sp. 'Peltigera malacea cyanobiont' DB3992]|uniref:hypothetical protein n=1 Tax=Nostoc sp. 'Peltigera malacea cyanobiont' DB3992 TaxID=1206980 RepID=UPI0015D50D2E|nr:hypothetical protein [Nostoc sp. 'Peltigera malacea cyanobiont' DB3992]